MVSVRPERAADYDAKRQVNDRAFGEMTEGSLVDRLRTEAESYVSLVAEYEGRVIGHVFFSPVHLYGEGTEVLGMGLAPMAVEPAFQSRGVGKLLAAKGLHTCRERGVAFVVVLGHPEYYPRFGFERASAHDVRCEYDVPDDAFMLIELTPGSIKGGGLVQYHPAFAAAADARTTNE